MVMFFSYIIATIITIIIACTLYPIAGVFFVIDKIGDAIGWISKKAFQIANGAVRYLWKDLANTRIVRNQPQNDNNTINNQNTEYIANNNINNQTTGTLEG